MGIFTNLIWLFALLALLMLLQRQLHFESQAVFLLLTRRPEIAIVLFSILLFPGVVLHEGSHFLVASLFGVSTGRFSLLPKPLPKGRLRLGYVETRATDPFRDALIGIAPLLAGCIFIAFVGLGPLRLGQLAAPLATGGLKSVLPVLSQVYQRPDFFLWFYLTFAVSSTMLPSASDRRAWVPIGIFFIVLAAIALLVGAGPWLVAHLFPRVNSAFAAVAMVFGISVAVHALLLPPLWLLRLALGRLTGMKVAKT